MIADFKRELKELLNKHGVTIEEMYDEFEYVGLTAWSRNTPSGWLETEQITPEDLQPDRKEK